MQDNIEKIEDIQKITRKFFSGVGFRYIVFFFAVFGAQIIFQFICLWSFGREALDTSLFQCLAMAVPVDLIGAPILYLMFLSRIKKDEEERRFYEQQGISFEVPREAYNVVKFIKLGCMLVPIVFFGALISTLLSSIISIVTGIKVDNNLVLESFMNINLWGRLIVTCVCAPIFEELVFRKLFIDRTVKYGEKVAVIMSGVMFGLFHGNFEQFFYACFLGMFFAYVYIRTGKIVYTMILHFMVNFSSAGIAQTIVSHLDMDLLQKVSDAGVTSMSASEMETFRYMSVWVTLYGAWAIAAVVMFIAGIVLWILTIVNHKIYFLPREKEIPKGLRFKLVFCNPGMIIYTLLCLALCVFTIISRA